MLSDNEKGLGFPGPFVLISTLRMGWLSATCPIVYFRQSLKCLEWGRFSLLRWLRYFDSQEHLLRKVRLEIGTQGYIFVDEIQRKENAGLFLKGLYDMDLPYQWIVSGSVSLELKEKIHESLAGRKRVFELSTLSWEELVDYRTSYRFEQNLGEFMDLEATKTKALLEEYLSFGGFPRIVLEQELSEKRKIWSSFWAYRKPRSLLAWRA